MENSLSYVIFCLLFVTTQARRKHFQIEGAPKVQKNLWSKIEVDMLL